MWPLKRHGELDRDADARLQNARVLAAEARNSRAKLRREIEKNGFTELFQQAMRRA